MYEYFAKSRQFLNDSWSNFFHEMNPFMLRIYDISDVT